MIGKGASEFIDFCRETGASGFADKIEKKCDVEESKKRTVLQVNDEGVNEDDE